MKDKKFTRNWRKSALTALLVSLTLSTAGGLASCEEDEPVHVPGLGFFYCDTSTGENQLALGDNYKATFNVNGESKEATYSIEGDVIKLTFSDGTTATAKMSSDTLMLTYQNGEYKFYKKDVYTVSYDEVGGSEVADSTVVNGQTLEKPADPKKDGYEFLGWYADSEYKTPYSFAQVVTGNITLYAQWALVDPSAVKYTVDFDLGYDGAEKLADMATIGGKLYNAPTPKRDGYKFCGWWVSMYEDGTKLTYKHNEDTVFTANTTLFALWEADNLGSKLSAPQVEVSETGVKWNGAQGVSRYKVKVTGPTGFNTVDEEPTGTNYNVDFANKPAGDYVITVTAISASGEANNSETVTRYYKNKAVGRVSQFTVIDGSRLLFNRVDNAETYYITVDCGDDEHKHETYNIGDSTWYDFSACEMQEGGIKFTVEARADGLASTTSETFVYNRVLDKVEGLSVDDETQELSWYPVKNATSYIVTVTCGDTAHTHQVVNNGTKTTFSLKECPADSNGKVKVSVYAQTTGYNSPEATELVYDKTKLASPSNVKLVSSVVEGQNVYKLTWKAVAGATGYSVKIGSTVLETATNEVDITTAAAWIEGYAYDVEVKAKNDTNESVWSDKVVIHYGAMNPSVKYKSGVVTWKATLGATGYQVRVESASIESYDADVTSAEVKFEKTGTNTIYVRCSYAQGFSNWVSVAVDNVQSIQYYDDGELLETAYKVLGDEVDAPVPEKDGYEFAGWYNTPKGPANNGTKYTDTRFASNTDLILYAYWTPATYAVEYSVGDGGTLSETEGAVTYTKGYKLAVPTVEDGSKVFLGWFAGPDSSAQQLTDDRGNSLKPWNLKQGATVYAHYVKDVLAFTLLEDGTYSVSKGRNVHKVTTITIPETYNNIAVTVVDGYAFEARSNIVSITMPDTIKIVERETAFRLCNGLQEINVYHVDGNNTPVYSSVDGVLLKKDDLTGQTQLCYYPLAKGGTYEIPEGVTEIPLNLFRESKIKEVVVPTSLAIIRENAFRDCAYLERVTFTEGGTDTLSIEDGAFSNCTALVEITLPNRLEELKVNEETRTLTLFDGCEALQYVNVERGSAYYSSVDGVLTNSARTKLLYCPAARTGSYTVPRGIVTVGERAFYNCTKLNEIIIPGYVEEIEDYAFYGCSKASRIVFDEGAVAGMELFVGDYAFAEMTNLKEVVFEDGSVVTSLGKYAFANASGLSKFVVPATMTTIGDYAFDNASALKTVSFAPDGKDLTFGNYVFNDCKALTKVELPATVVKLNLGVFDGCVNISEVKVHQDNQYYKDDDGIVFSKDGKDLLFFPKGRQGDANGEYVIPVGVENISEGAFKGMRYIEKIVIRNTITHIGKNAFANSMQLATLEFESGNDTAKLTIGENAFEGCAKVQTVALPTRTEIIEAKAFYNVSMTSVTFPAGLTTIGDYAFSNSSLKTVEIPAGLTTFGTNVFDSCVALTSVTFAQGFNATEIPVGTFKNSGLKTIEIPASIEKIGYMAFNDCVSLETVTFANGTANLIIGYLPESMDAGDDASGGKGKEESASGAVGVFAGCTKLKTIEIPDRATYIGKYAFSRCTNLGTVTINETSTLQRIDYNAFADCTSMKSIYIPKSVQNTAYVDEQTSQEYAIGREAFSNVPLKEITFAEGGTGELSIGSMAFSATAFATVDLPKRIAPIYVIEYGSARTYEGIDSNTFNSKTLTDINIEQGGTYYGSKDGVLYRVKNNELQELMYVPKQKTGSITVPKTVTLLANNCASGSLVSSIVWEDAEDANGLPLTIGNSALRQMPNLMEVRFPERTISIGSSMFSNPSNAPSTSNPWNSKVKSVYIPTNVETIGSNMFDYCTTIENVTFGDNCKITEIPNNMFNTANASATYGNNLQAIRIPANVETIGQYAFRGCTKLTSFTFEDINNCKLTKLSGSIFEGMPLEELSIPNSVVDLDGSVFKGMTKLKVLNLPSGFTNISTMGNQNQQNFLFSDCSALEAVNIDPANQYFKSVDGVVFTKDGKSLIYYPANKPVGNEILDEEGKGTGAYDGVYVTPAGCQTIATYAFQDAKNIRELVVSADLMYINREAFGKFGSSRGYLKKLTFADRESTLSIGDYAFYYCYGLGNNGADTLTLPEEVELAGTNVFSNTRYGKVVFEEGNTTTSLNNTFYGCSYLKEVTGIPEFITSMTSTFEGCSELTKVEFAEGAYVETMKATFYECKKLENIYIPAVGSMTVSAGKGVFENCIKLQNVTFDECGYIGEDAFRGCTVLKNFVMPDTVSGMDANAFYGCTSLESVTLSAGLESISANAFYNCTKLSSVEIKGFVSSIGDSAFYNCTKLTSVTLPDGLVSIGNKAFYGANLVEEIVLPESLEIIGDYAFYGWSNLKKVDVPATVKTIGNYAFSGCSSVEEFNIPEGALLESLGDYSLEGMSKLTEFFIPATLTRLGMGVFTGWSQLDNIEVEAGNLEFAYDGGILYNSTYTSMILVTPKVPETLKIRETITSLARGVFAGLTFKRVELPDTITEIPANAFRGCVNLESVKMPKYLEKIGEAAFEGCVSLQSIDIPNTVHSTMDKKESIMEGKGAPMLMGYYATVMADGIGKYAFANCTSLEEVNFVAGGAQRLSFGDFAFYNCSKLTSFSIPNRVRSQAIPNNFYNADGPQMQGDMNFIAQWDVSHKTFEQGIGMYCFAMCTNLKTVVFEEATDNTTFAEGLFIRVGAFTGCTKLETVQFNSALRDHKEVMVGEKGDERVEYVYAIQGRAFDGCTALKNVTFVETDYQVTVRNTAFKDSKIELPKFITLDTGSGNDAEQKLFLGGCSTCAFSSTNPGQKCTGFDPVGDGIVAEADILRGVVVDDATRKWNNKPVVYAFNGLDRAYSTGNVEQCTSLNSSYKYKYSYKVVSYNAETGIVTLHVTGTNKNAVGYSTRVTEYNKTYVATVDLNAKTFTLGAEITE